MSGFYPVPPTLTARLVAKVPSELYAQRETEWLLPSTLKPPPIFLEGITTDTNGNLYVVDVPYGRVLKLDLHGSGQFSVVAEWDGEPNGLALSDDGTLGVADYKQGVLRLDPADGKVTPLLTRRNLERFKGPNDLIYAKNGDMYFTDQGQTGLTDPTGHVYRLGPTGKLDALITNGPSPNGLVLSPDEKFLYVAMTRDNSVWRCPLHPDGTTTKVVRFYGLTVDSLGNLFICHPGLSCVFVVEPTGIPKARIVMPGAGGAAGKAHVTNCIFGSTAADAQTLYFVDSSGAGIYAVDWDAPAGTPLRASNVTTGP
ncbi:hypothetical protein EHS25_003327 [Saitozyma podzolica]|uniref:SMP-30/Gluconolactonase/LRE-like region domain-containing protein n=1 Tax=Saitozyma podzolica TaxID=1890683 RepID=A0A427Y8W7_9TREE|nr:hypothetical protein EHS25_003327 [Saitozyma podzolica]